MTILSLEFSWCHISASVQETLLRSVYMSLLCKSSFLPTKPFVTCPSAKLHKSLHQIIPKNLIVSVCVEIHAQDHRSWCMTRFSPPGSPTFVRIYRNKSVESFSADPYQIALLKTMFWCFYGLPMVSDETSVATIGAIGSALGILWVSIFLIFSKGRLRVSRSTRCISVWNISET